MAARDDGGPIGRRLVAYVVPEPVVAASAGGEEGLQHVEQWRELYEQTYAEEPPPATEGDAAFNLQGWNSSYTGEPIPAAEMREWLEGTVGRLLALPHRRVIEVGCGTGLLLFRVAPEAERYRGTDFSATVLARVQARAGAARPAAGRAGAGARRRLEGRRGRGLRPRRPQLGRPVLPRRGLPGEGARRRGRGGGAGGRGVRGGRAQPAAARRLPGLRAARARRRVAAGGRAGAAGRTAGRGRGGAGDRSRPLPGAGPAAAGGPPGRGAAQAGAPRQRADPLPLRRGPPRRGRGGGRRRAHPQAWESAAALERLLAARPAVLALAGIPNARLAREAAALELLAGDGREMETVEELRAEIDRRVQARPAVDPEDLWSLADRLGYDADLTWSAGGGVDGRFDAVLRRRGAGVSPAWRPVRPDGAGAPLERLCQRSPARRPGAAAGARAAAIPGSGAAGVHGPRRLRPPRRPAADPQRQGRPGGAPGAGERPAPPRASGSPRPPPSRSCSPASRPRCSASNGSACATTSSTSVAIRCSPPSSSRG